MSLVSPSSCSTPMAFAPSMNRRKELTPANSRSLSARCCIPSRDGCGTLPVDETRATCTARPSFEVVSSPPNTATPPVAIHSPVSVLDILHVSAPTALIHRGALFHRTVTVVILNERHLRRTAPTLVARLLRTPPW